MHGISQFRQGNLGLLTGDLPRPRIEIPGPQGMQATFDWQAAKAVSPARMCSAVLVTTVVIC